MDDLIDEEEEIMNEEMQGGMPPEEDQPIKLLGQADMAKFERQWRRPPLPALNPETDSLDFQQFEADYSTSPIPPEFARGSTEPKAAVVRLFGVTRGGNSVVAHVHGFRP